MDLSSGTVTPVGPIGFGAVRGMAFDSNSGTLYAVNGNSSELLVIDRASGAGVAVGALGFGDVRGLTFAGNTSTLYGTDADTNQLIVINTATGAGTVVGATVATFSALAPVK